MTNTIIFDDITNAEYMIPANLNRRNIGLIYLLAADKNCYLAVERGDNEELHTLYRLDPSDGHIVDQLAENIDVPTIRATIAQEEGIR